MPRKRPPTTRQRNILKLQGNKCYWCNREFGSYLYLKSKLVRLIYHFDHVIPYAYTQTNYKHNFVAACQLCNEWKSSKIFYTDNIHELIGEMRYFLAEKWGKLLDKGIIKELSVGQTIGNSVVEEPFYLDDKVKTPGPDGYYWDDKYWRPIKSP